MQKKLILPIILGVGASALLTPLQYSMETSAEEKIWSYDREQYLDIGRVFPSENYIEGVFNATIREDLYTKRICFFTYHEDMASQGKVETNISDLEKGLSQPEQSPDWLKQTECYRFPSGEISVFISSFMQDQIMEKNLSGVIYYAVELDWRERSGPDWVWGKVDYRRCSYNASSDPHLSEKCMKTSDEDGWVREDGTSLDTEYTSWTEELEEILNDKISVLSTKVDNWQDDEPEKKSILKSLYGVQSAAADANNGEDLYSRAQALIEKLTKKSEIIPEPTPGPVPPVADPEPTEDPEKPKEDENNKRPSISGGQVANSVGGGSIELIVEPAEPGISTDKEQSDIVAVAGTENKTPAANDGQNYNSNNSDSGNGSSVDPEKEILGDEQEEAKDPQNTKEGSGVGVPALNNEKEKNNSWLWWIIGILLVSGGAIWWCKRAFIDKSSNKY